MNKSKKNARSLMRTIYSLLSITVILFAYVNCSPVHNVIDNTDLGANLDDGGDNNPPLPPTDPPPASATKVYFTCSPSMLGVTTSQRLSKREYENTLKDLLGLINTGVYDSTIAGYVAQLPNDQVQGKEDTTLIYQSQIINYEAIAFYTGTRIAASSTYLGAIPGTSNCLTASTVTDACITNFVNGFGIKVFRRPLTSTEVTTYKNIYNNPNFAAKADKVTAVIAVFLQSPDFLYRMYDQGVSNPNFANSRILTDYELASKISYLITGTMPDSTLFSKAANGTLSSSTSNLKTEVVRLLAKSSARTTLNRFFLEWLKYDQYETFQNYPASMLNGISIDGLPDVMTKEVSDTIANVVFNQKGSFQDLMSTTNSVVTDSRLASIYGINNPNGSVNLGSTRAGVLSRAAFLARKPSSLTSPQKRGKFVLTNILCEELGSPPPGAPTQVDPLPAGTFLTTRDRVNLLTVENNGQPVVNCVGCHSRMNPLGYTFESFDPLGRLRPNNSEVVTNTVNGQTSSQTLPLNTTVSTNELVGSMDTIDGYLDLQHKIGQSSKALSCMTIKWFDFLQKRAPTSEDNCYMNEVLDTVYGTDIINGQGSIQDMVINTVLSDKFKYWKY